MSEQDPTIFDPPEEKKTASGPNHFNFWSAGWSIISAALITATLFTLWTPANLFSNQMLDRVFQTWNAEALPTLPTATALPSPRIGIVAGHYPDDSGAVCDDGLTEMEVNLKIATLVKQDLASMGYQVDLLEEFDPRLSGYRGVALISIHNDSCTLLGPDYTGFKVAAAASTAYIDNATHLRDCLVARYAEVTGLSFHPNTITDDMTEYHTFGEIHTDTTAAIIETGFLNEDRVILTQNTDLVADGVVAGILCYLRNENIQRTVPNPAP